MASYIPKTASYLRVSTDRQDLEKDKIEVLKLAKEKGFGEVKFVEEKITGKAPWKTRKIKFLIDDLQKYDRLIIPELSRLGRSMLEVMEILSVCTEKGIEVYSIRDHWELNATLQSKVIATVFAMAAEIERDLISLRTKEAMRAKKAMGVHFGTPFGAQRSKLDKHKIEIWALHKNGHSNKIIGKRFGMSYYAVYQWLKTRKIQPEDEEAIREKMEELAGLNPLGPNDRSPLWGMAPPDDSIPELPHGCIDKMRDAVLNARLDILIETTDEAEAYDKCFADKLRTFAKRYDYESIFKLLGIHFTKGGGS